VKLGDPTPERDLIYVEDHVDAYLSCLNHPKALGQTFNFGSGERITVRAVAEKLAALTGHKGQILWNTIPKRPLDIQILYGDSTKAMNVLGWSPKVSLDEGLRLTMEFWKKKLAGADSGRARTATS
jgi:nucleoside-diphosphate-sugar epimerase